MIHNNMESFEKIIQNTAKQTGFPVLLVEKDYYLTLILSHINELSENLIFKGGTCLNKIYFSYYRLSEDLDFSMKLPQYTVSRSIRKKCMQSVKKDIYTFAKSLNMQIDTQKTDGYNESKQYIYYLLYNSSFIPNKQHVKVEIGLRYNPLDDIKYMPVNHKFLHPFTKKPLFDGGKVKCLSLREVVCEKLRAAAFRKTIASRDFYDIDFLIRNGFDFSDKKIKTIFIKKIEEDGKKFNSIRLKTNLGRSNEEVSLMHSLLKEELYDVLTLSERNNFDLTTALHRIDKIMTIILN